MSEVEDIGRPGALNARRTHIVRVSRELAEQRRIWRSICSSSIDSDPRNWLRIDFVDCRSEP